MAKPARTTTQVLHDHLYRRLADDLEGDLVANYSPDVVVLSSFSTFRGHDGVRQSAELLADVAKDVEFAYNRTVVEGEYAFLEWTARQGGQESVRDGSDSFHIVDGLIVLQTIHYSAVPQEGRLQ